MALKRPPSWKALITRYRAGIQAVERGADPYLTLSLVVWPPSDVELASKGELPRGWRYLTDEEYREQMNEQHRRRYAPKSAKWKRAA